MYKLFDSNIDDDDKISVSLESRYESDFVKTAGKRDLPAEVDEVIKNMVRKPNHAYMLVTAMGDGETWGANKNGDFFPYDALFGMQNKPVWGIQPDKDERLKDSMDPKQRFRTFDDSHFFKLHKNKFGIDPHFGYVERAIWNPKMRTVLLVIGVDRAKAPGTAEKIDRNELVAVSMGAKLPWDRCSICQSKHKTLPQYCHHLKFQMGHILPDGQRVYAENLFPRFFDISEVRRPAFLAGMQLEKIAGVEYSIDLAEEYDIGRFDKYAESEKQAVLYKHMPAHVEGAIARVCETEKDLPHQLLRDLAQLKPQEAWGALTHAGIIAKPNEFAYIVLHPERPDLAEKFLRAKGVVSNPDVKGLDMRLHGMAEVNINHAAVALSKSIPSRVIDERSVSSVGDRIYATDRGLRKSAGAEGVVGLGSILSALYMLYRKNAETRLGAYGLLGAGIGLMAADKDDAPKFIGNNPYITDEMNKRAGVAAKIGIGAAGFALPYVAGAHYQNKLNQGQQVGVLGRFVANNAGKLGVVGAAGLTHPAEMYGGIKNVASDVMRGIKTSLKS